MIRSHTPLIARPLSARRSLGHKIRWSVLAVALAALGRLDAAPAELKTQGNQIVKKATGERVRLVGANFSGLEDGYNRNFMNSLEVAVGTWKANVIRLPVSDWRWMNSDLTARAAYRSQIDAIIQRATELNIYVIFDLHNYAKVVASDLTFWNDAAAVYANNPTVLFGLLNEPHGTGWPIWRDGDAPGLGMQGLLNTVRATGANNIVLAGGGDWGYDLSGVLPGAGGRANGYALDDTASGNGVVYDSHVYPWKSNIQANVGNVALLYPVLLGEFGHPGGTNFDNHPTFETDATWVPRMMDWVNTNNLHWVGWNFSDGSGPSMLTDWSYNPTAYWGAFARSHMQSYADPAALRVVGGTVIGTTGTKSSPTSGVITDVQRGAVAPFGNSQAYFFEAANPNGDWTGLDLGSAKRITQIKYMAPKVNSDGSTGGGLNLVGGVFEGSNSATFSSGVGTLYTITTAPYDIFVGNQGTFTTVPVTNTNTYRYVRYRGPDGKYCRIGSILFYTGDDSGPGVNDDVIIIDNGGTGSTVSAGWTNVSGSGYHGTTWVSDGNNGKGTKTIRYTPTIMKAGLYEVFALWPANLTARCPQVPYTITFDGAESPKKVYKDQRYDGSSWQSLGTFNFAAGTTGNVLLSNADTIGNNYYVAADAVKFVYRPPVDIVMDKGPTDTAGIVSVGGWGSSSSPGAYGTASYHDGNTHGGKSVRFTPPIPLAGQYKVSVWWTQNLNRATNVPITVYHAGGSSAFTVNQEANGGKWNELNGTFTFAAGSNTATGSVLITNEGADEYVVVDAVRFVKIN